MKKSNMRLYNLILPIWLLMLFPPFWIIVVPANYLIDLIVLRLTMKHMEIENHRELCKKIILKVWMFGFASDFIGGLCMLTWNLFDVPNAEFSNAIFYNPFKRLDSFLWVTGCVLLSACIIYLANKKVCLKSLPLTIKQKHKLALSLAVFTAPYLFYLPTIWFL